MKNALRKIRKILIGGFARYHQSIIEKGFVLKVVLSSKDVSYVAVQIGPETWRKIYSNFESVYVVFKTQWRSRTPPRISRGRCTLHEAFVPCNSR
ncbi:MAG: hypothetical protein AAFX94_02865, partial [Myxococcota bacterium]